MEPRMWVLGAPDPEMQEIEKVLTTLGAVVRYAAVDGRRVHPGNAYKATGVLGGGIAAPDQVIYLVECDLPLPGKVAVVVDHHHPGDPGYGRPPEEFLAGSSLGQVLEILGLEATEGQRLAAAADHCLEAAYRGRCPGVDPDALANWRAASRAAFQKRETSAVLADVERARAILRAGRQVMVAGIYLRDLRPGSVRGEVPCGEHGPACPGLLLAGHEEDGTARWTDRPGCWGDVPELPEAAAREGEAFLAIPKPGPDGRRKLVLQAAAPAVVAEFLRDDGPFAYLSGRYGDPARGFAGGYL